MLPILAGAIMVRIPDTAARAAIESALNISQLKFLADGSFLESFCIGKIIFMASLLSSHVCNAFSDTCAETQFMDINKKENMDKIRIFIIYNDIMMSKDNYFFCDMLTFH